MTPNLDAHQPDVLVIHGDVYGFGGAESHCLRVVEILQQLGRRVTVLHAGGPLDADRIYKWCGIHLDPNHVCFRTAAPFDRFPNFVRGLILLRFAFVLRAARRITMRYRLVIGTYGETSVPARQLIQSLHVPLFFYDKESLRYLGFDAELGKLRYWLRVLYVLSARHIGRWQRSAVENARLLTNSRWTANQFLRHYPRSRPQTIYHGAQTEIDASSPEYLPFHLRQRNFVALGRIVPFKRIEMAIALIEQLRLRGHDVGLIIIGNGTGPYADKIQEMVDARPYVSWRKNLSRDDLERLVAQQTWGIHCARFEHYGYAAIELQRLGCVTFVADSGGQTEVVTRPDLRFVEADDALAKLEAVVASEGLGERLFQELRVSLHDHSVARYRQAFLEYLEGVGT